MGKEKPQLHNAIAVWIGCRTRIRTLTNGVRDRCATVTQFGNAFYNSGIIANRNPKINIINKSFDAASKVSSPDRSQTGSKGGIAPISVSFSLTLPISSYIGILFAGLRSA